MSDKQGGAGRAENMPADRGPGLEAGVIHRIPACPFSQRLEILLALKGRQDAVRFETVDITRPRDPALLLKTRGTTALPVLECREGPILKESLVILRYLDERLEGPKIRREDCLHHAIETMLIGLEPPLTAAGYALVMNRDYGARRALKARLLGAFGEISRFLEQHHPQGTYLFDAFGLAETVFAPIFMRFWFLDYYEGFRLPETADFARIRKWMHACLDHPAAQQVTREEIVKLYYDYAMGFGNGALPEGRTVSSFAFAPHWRQRPWPPADKYGRPATDAELGLLST